MRSQTPIISLLALGALAGVGGLLAADSAPDADTARSLSSAPSHECVCEKVPVGLSYLPGTPWKLRQRIEQILWNHWVRNLDNPLNYELGPRWPGGQGDPTELTWSVVPDGLFIPNALGEGGGNSNFRASLDAMFGSEEAGLNKLRQVFDRWEELTGIDYTEVSDDGATWGASGNGNRGDIRLSMKNFSNNFFGVLAYNYFPDNGDMVMNSDHNGDFDSSFGDFRFFRNTVAHENGHGIGLGHVCPANGTKLMEPFISVGFDGPAHDDRRGAQRHYGDPLENNNSSNTPFDFGSLGNGVELRQDLSIDDNTDLDWFIFTVGPEKAATITATPIGFTYQSGPQTQFCNSGSTINSLTIHDLKLQLRDTDGNTVLVDMDEGGDGDVEVIDGFVLPGAGTYYLRVAGDSTSDVQMYDLSVEITDVDSEFEPVTIADFDIEKGTLIDGNIGDLIDSDDQVMKINSERGFLANEANVNEVYLLFLSPSPNVTAMNLRFETRLDNPGGEATVRMQDYDDDTLVTVAEFDMETSDTLHEFDDIPDPNRFINDADFDQVEMYFKNVVIAVFSASGFNSFHDRIAVEVLD